MSKVISLNRFSPFRSIRLECDLPDEPAAERLIRGAFLAWSSPYNSLTFLRRHDSVGADLFSLATSHSKRFEAAASSLPKAPYCDDFGRRSGCASVRFSASGGPVRIRPTTDRTEFQVGVSGKRIRVELRYGDTPAWEYTDVVSEMDSSSQQAVIRALGIHVGDVALKGPLEFDGLEVPLNDLQFAGERFELAGFSLGDDVKAFLR